MNPMDETLDELEGYVSYCEEAPPESLRPGEARLARITERLRKLKESLNE